MGSRAPLLLVLLLLVSAPLSVLAEHAVDDAPEDASQTSAEPLTEEQRLAMGLHVRQGWCEWEDTGSEAAGQTNRQEHGQDRDVADLEMAPRLVSHPGAGERAGPLGLKAVRERFPRRSLRGKGVR